MILMILGTILILTIGDCVDSGLGPLILARSLILGIGDKSVSGNLGTCGTKLNLTIGDKLRFWESGKHI